MADRKNTDDDTNMQQPEQMLNSDDFYKELRIRGYEYGPEFCTIESCSMTG